MTRDEAIEFSQSLAWQSFEKELRKIADSNTEKLISCIEAKEIVRLQESIKAIRKIVLLPENIAEREE